MSEASANPSLVVVWECHRACDDGCLHRRPEGHSVSKEREFSSWEGHSLIRDIANLQPGRFVIGGDVLSRRDHLQLIDLAKRAGIAPWVSLTPTASLTPAAIDAFAWHGAAGLIFALEASEAETHDEITGLDGSFDLTADAIVNARIKSLKVEIVTNLWKHNFDQLELIADFAEELDVQRWTIFLPVPGNESRFDVPTPTEIENLWTRLERIDEMTDIEIEIEEGQFFRRHRLEHWIEDRRRWLTERSNNDGVTPIEPEPKAPVKGRPHEMMFISHVGEIYLGNQMTLTGGNVHFESLEEIYETSPVFRMLRDRSLLVGKCGTCEFREVCGGSRARALAMTGDPMEGDPLCIYQPGTLKRELIELRAEK